ncbi:MAG: hypothetical protein F6J87_05955 [Spirulina sp. SIO3F2]|nr:hypothetical protein [Spirulina sp. SIO3F2]
MLKSASVIVTAAALTTLTVIAPSLAQTPNPAELWQIQNTEPECPPDVAGCPIRGDYFTWLNEPIPYVLSPRRGKSLTAQPILRWLPVEGAIHYSILLEGLGLEWRVENVMATEVKYDGDPLQPGDAYQLFVRANTGPFSWREPAHPGGIGEFGVLTSEERAVVESAIAELRQTTSDPDIVQLQIANFYIEQDLITAGIAELEALWQQQPSAELAVRLGNLHFEWLLLVEPSETYYRQALDLTAEAPSLARAVALTQLGHLHIVKQEFGAAIEFWRQAQVVYRTVGDPQAAAELEAHIERWHHKTVE